MGTGPAANRDDVPTVAEPAASTPRLDSSGAAPAASPLGEPTSSGTTSLVTAGETLYLQEIARTRLFVPVIIAFAALVIGTVSLIGGDPTAKRLLVFALLASAGASAWLGWLIRRDHGYTTARVTAVAYVCIVGAYAGVWFFGVFSPAPMFLLFGLSFFTMAQSARAAFAAYLTCALLQLGLMLGVATGLLRDPGLIHARDLSPLEQTVVIVLVEATMLVAYLVQRKTRDTTIHAIERHDHVVRSLAHREALLREAQQELVQAMRGGGDGRWTEQVVGSFTLGRVLGRGAMGEVYEAVHRTTGEPAAVKLLQPQVLAQPEMVQRFLREARIVASLDVGNVVRVLEVAPPDAPLPYLAMERLVGTDLSDYLREHKRMSARDLLVMLRHVGAGLDAAWAAGVVHRDLKPRNLFLSRQGAQEVWKILDFGVARLAGDETLTHDQIVGTPNYMSPEQANGRPVTLRSDLFALGVIAYRALTGHPAFDGTTTAEILYKVVHAMPVRPTTVTPLPLAFDQVLAIALAKEPADRFESVADLIHALEGAASDHIDPSVRARAQRLLGKLPWSET
jgi:serine/threonine-protein kinase